jgi:hypothetical protein
VSRLVVYILNTDGVALKSGGLSELVRLYLLLVETSLFL